MMSKWYSVNAKHGEVLANISSDQDVALVAWQLFTFFAWSADTGR